MRMRIRVKGCKERKRKRKEEFNKKGLKHVKREMKKEMKKRIGTKKRKGKDRMYKEKRI